VDGGGKEVSKGGGGGVEVGRGVRTKGEERGRRQV